MFAAEQHPLDSCQQELQSPKATFNLVFFFPILSEKTQRVAKGHSVYEVLSSTSNVMFKKTHRKHSVIAAITLKGQNPGAGRKVTHPIAVHTVAKWNM